MSTDLDLIARYRAAKEAVRALAARERTTGVTRVTEERLAANARLTEIERRLPWHLR